MVGPKLDARSYAILVLVVIAGLLSATLVAQRGDYSSASSQQDLANATRAVADATKAVADSNRAIAEAINNLARPFQDMSRSMAEGQRTAPPAAGGGDGIPVGTPAPDEDEGVFELD